MFIIFKKKNEKEEEKKSLQYPHRKTDANSHCLRYKTIHKVSSSFSFFFSLFSNLLIFALYPSPNFPTAAGLIRPYINICQRVGHSHSYPLKNHPPTS